MEGIMYELVQYTGEEHEHRRGPFRTQGEAWIYLFGGIPTESEIELQKSAGWSVQYIQDHAKLKEDGNLWKSNKGNQ